MPISTVGANGLNRTEDFVIDGLTVGQGGSSSNTNTVVGAASALAANTSGTYNNAFGRGALQQNTTGSYNSAFGWTALLNTTTGSYNTAIGNAALVSNTTASYNTAVGYQAKSTGSGGYNSCFGAGSGSVISTGAENTLIGYFAGGSLSSGNKNLFIGGAQGNGSGGLITTGSSNTVIGSFSGNQGGLDIRTSSNRIVLSDGDGTIRYYDNATTSFIAGSISTQQGDKTSIAFPFGVFGGGVVSGTSAYNTNITINQGGGAACALLMISSNAGAGTVTRNAVYSIQFYFDGNNTPTLRFISGSHDYISAGQSGGTLTLTSGYNGNHYYSWWINKP